MPPARPETARPQVPALRLGDLDEGEARELRTNADLEGACFTDLALPELAMRGAVARLVRFTGLSAQEADLAGSRFVEVDLDRVHLPVLKAARSQWRDVRLNGRIGGLEAYEAQWRSVHFVGCKLDYVNLRGAELLDVAFTDCVVGELDLLDARVRRMAVDGTRVTHLDVRGARLSDLDLRGAQLDGLEGLTDLGGATVSRHQLALLAPLLAEQVGIRVED
ncbi:pentapeptide repeat-containing protein [Alloalcanivorax gelatiniphagus]